MSLNKKALTPWVITESTGKIISAHCDSMVGLGESCSHVDYLLWANESGVRIRDSMTVTQKKAYWIIPNGIKEVPHARVKDSDFIRGEMLVSNRNLYIFLSFLKFTISYTYSSKSIMVTYSNFQGTRC